MSYSYLKPPAMTDDGSLVSHVCRRVFIKCKLSCNEGVFDGL